MLPRDPNPGPGGLKLLEIEYLNLSTPETLARLLHPTARMEKRSQTGQVHTEVGSSPPSLSGLPCNGGTTRPSP